MLRRQEIQRFPNTSTPPLRGLRRLPNPSTCDVTTAVLARFPWDLHQAVEDERIADPRVVAAQRVPVLAHGQQREELVADRGENA